MIYAYGLAWYMVWPGGHSMIYGMASSGIDISTVTVIVC